MFYIIIILFLFKLIKYNSKFTIINSTITGRVCVRIFRKLAKAAFHRRYRPLSQPAGLVSGAILSLVRSLTLAGSTDAYVRHCFHQTPSTPHIETFNFINLIVSFCFFYCKIAADYFA